jgi:hypothetical protein
MATQWLKSKKRLDTKLDSEDEVVVKGLVGLINYMTSWTNCNSSKMHYYIRQ